MDTLSTVVNIALIRSIAAATPGPNFVLTVWTATGVSRPLGLATTAGVAPAVFDKWRLPRHLSFHRCRQGGRC